LPQHRQKISRVVFAGCPETKGPPAAILEGRLVGLDFTFTPCPLAFAMSDRLALARAIAVRSEPRFIEIKPEPRRKVRRLSSDYIEIQRERRGGKVPFRPKSGHA